MKNAVLWMTIVTSVFLVANSVSSQANGDIPSLSLHSDCISNNCVEMTLNWGAAVPNYTATKETASGYTTFSFDVKGKLNGEPPSIHSVEFEGYTGGPKCSDFGQGNVGVLGIRGGRPTLETSGGSLEIVDRSLNVGCAGCIRLVNERTGDVVERYTSPAWDLTLVGISYESIGQRLSYDSKNKVFLTNDEGNCMQITDHGLISASAPVKCRRLEEIERSHKDFEYLMKGEQGSVFRQTHSDNVMIVLHGACT